MTGASNKSKRGKNKFDKTFTHSKTEPITARAEAKEIELFTAEHLTIMLQLRKMRQYFENHQYYDCYNNEGEVFDLLEAIIEKIEMVAISIGELIAFEVKNNAFYFDAKDAEKEIVLPL